MSQAVQPADNKEEWSCVLSAGEDLFMPRRAFRAYFWSWHRVMVVGPKGNFSNIIQEEVSKGIAR